MLLCLPVLGLSVFSSQRRRPRRAGRGPQAKGVEAEGLEAAEGFVVRAGSAAVRREVASCHAYLKELRAAFVDQRRAQPSGARLHVHPGLCVPVAVDRRRCGARALGERAVEWKTREGKTLKELQEADATA